MSSISALPQTSTSASHSTALVNKSQSIFSFSTASTVIWRRFVSVYLLFFLIKNSVNNYLVAAFYYFTRYKLEFSGTLSAVFALTAIFTVSKQTKVPQKKKNVLNELTRVVNTAACDRHCQSCLKAESSFENDS